MTAKRITRKFEVSTTTCDSAHLMRSTIVSVENHDDAVERGIEKMYGYDCFWFEDSGLPGYGQIFRALRPTKNNSHPGNSSVTYRVSLDVRPLAKKSLAFRRQEREDQREAEDQAVWRQKLSQANRRGYYEEREAYEKRRDEDRRVQDEQAMATQERECEQRRLEDEWASQMAYTAHTGRIQAEVDRLRSIDLSQPITDERLAQIIRNTIAPATYPHGMTLGEYKNRMLNGEHAELVHKYLMSEAIYARLENVID